jgi:hypothetical protein
MSESRVIVYGIDSVTGNLVPLQVGVSGATAVNLTQVLGQPVSQGNPIPILSEVTGLTGNGAGVITATNGTPEHGASDVSMLSAAVRTGNINTEDFVQVVNLKQLIAVIRVTALANPITPKIQGQWGNTYYDILTGAAIAAPGVVLLRLSPYLTAVPSLVAADILPPVFRLSLATTGNHTTEVRFLVTQ